MKIITALILSLISISVYAHPAAQIYGIDLVCYQVITNQIPDHFLTAFIHGYVSGFNAASSMIGDKQIPTDNIVNRVKGRCLEKPSEHLISVIQADAFPRKYSQGE